MENRKINMFIVLIVIWLSILGPKSCFGNNIDPEIISLINMLKKHPDKITALTKNELIILEKIKTMILYRINQENASNFWILRQG